MGDRSRPAGKSPWYRLADGLRASSHWLLPPLCISCHKTVSYHDSLCAGCWRSVHFISAPLCDRLGIPMPYDTGALQISAGALAEPPDYDRARAAAHYMGPVRVLVHRLKYQDQLEPRRLMARWLTVAGRDLLADADIVIPVPLNRRRLFWRRFNQAAVVGRDVAALSGVPFAPLVLQRLKNTPAQVGLTEAQRALNVRGAFKVVASGRHEVAGRKVVLIDDVITTGATANACARALKRSGAARVDVLAIALVTAFSRTLPMHGIGRSDV